MDVVTLAAAKASAKKLHQPLVGILPGTVWALGDSISANDYSAPSGTNGHIFRPRCWLMHASLLSGGKIKFGGIAATGGYTTAQVISTHLPTVIAARPQFCVVHCGTNDPGTLTVAQSIANLTSIYTQLMAAGITPILTTYLPKHTLPNAARSPLDAMGLFNARYARDHCLPLLDWTSPFINPANGDWSGYSATPSLATWNYDDTHPNAAAAKVMGQSLVTALSGLPLSTPFLACGPYLPGGLQPSSTNATLLNDGNSNGRPDGMDYSNGAAGATYSLTSMGADGVGNYFNVARGSADVLVQSDNSDTIPTGHVIGFACKIKTSALKSTSANFDLRVSNGASDVDLFSLREWTEDIPAGSVFAGEFTVPAGMSSNVLHLMEVISAGAATVSIGQLTFYDMTDAAIV